MLKKLEKSPWGSLVVIGSLVLASWAVFAYSLGNLPSLMQDELIYSIESRRLEPSERSFANHLFYSLFSVTSSCGAAFYQCAKVLNHIILFFSAIVVFFIARGYATWGYAYLASLLVVLGPTALYGSTFMPETLFFLLIIASAGFLVYKVSYSQKFLVFSGTSFVLVGLASLVKPHALLYLLSFAVFVFWRFKKDFEGKLLSALGISIAGILIALVVNVLGWLLLTGGQGPALLGSYAGAFSSDQPDNSETLSVWTLFSNFNLLINAAVFTISKSGQLLIAMLLPLAALILLWARSSSRKGPLTDFLITTLPINILLIGAFTMYVTYFTGDDHSGRVLLRYLEWYFPLIVIWGLSLVKSEKATSLPKRYGSIIAVIVTLILVLGLGLGPERIILVDSTALFGLLREPGFTSTVVLFTSILLLLSLVQHRFITQLLTVSTLAIFFAIGINGQVLQQRINGTAVSSDYAGQYIWELTAGEDAESVHIVGSDKQLMLASLFQADQSDYSYELYEAGTLLVPGDLPEGKTLIIESLGVGFTPLEAGFTRVSKVQNGRLILIAEFDDSGKSQ